MAFPTQNQNRAENSCKHNSEHSEVFAIWREIQGRIGAACARSGRSRESVHLLGASKTVSAARLEAFIAAGLSDAGENYVQEGLAKKAMLQNLRVRWHFIGALQSKKASLCVREFALIHSVDRAMLATALDKAARQAEKVQDVLLQVNLGDEDSKGGCGASQLFELARFCADLQNLRVRGLMCLPPYNANAEVTRPYFRQLRNLREDVTAQNWRGAEDCRELSMGMSDDFEVAIEEGATIIRLGTALFGSRAK